MGHGGGRRNEKVLMVRRFGLQVGLRWKERSGEDLVGPVKEFVDLVVSLAMFLMDVLAHLAHGVEYLPE
jgi:hypothetical protein